MLDIGISWCFYLFIKIGLPPYASAIILLLDPAEMVLAIRLQVLVLPAWHCELMTRFVMTQLRFGFVLNPCRTVAHRPSTPFLFSRRLNSRTSPTILSGKKRYTCNARGGK